MPFRRGIMSHLSPINSDDDRETAASNPSQQPRLSGGAALRYQQNLLDQELTQSLAARGTAAFAKVSESLIGVRDLQMQIADDLTTFAELATGDTEKKDPLANLIHCLKDTSEAFAEYAVVINDARAPDQEQNVLEHLEKISRYAIVLQSVSTLIHVTTASYKIRSLDGYLSELQLVASDLRTSASEVKRQLSVLGEGEVSTLANCRQASCDLDDLRPLIEKRHVAIVELAQQEFLIARKITTRAGSLTREGQEHLKTFVTAIQFSDRLSQRLTHLGQVIAYDDPGLFRLSAAHAHHLAKDIMAICNQIRFTMEALTGIGRAAFDIFNDDSITNTVGISVNSRRETIEEIVLQIEPVTKTVGIAKQDAAKSKAAMAEATNQFVHLEEISSHVAVAAINSTLVASRTARARNALTTISSEVRQTATQCLATVKGSKAAMDSLHQATAGAQDLILNAGTSLALAVLSYSEQNAQNEKRLKNINKLKSHAAQTSENLLAHLQTVVLNLENIESIANKLLDLGENYLQRAGDETPDPNLLSRIWGIYTMDEEREIHASLFEDSPKKQAANAPALGDDLDMLLF